MSLIKPVPGVRRASDAGRASGRDPTRAETEKTLKRDDYTCRCCGFRALRFQRVVPTPDNASSDPFITVCFYCDMVLGLDRVGMNGSGVLIWLPEIGQADLNHIVRAIYVARDGGDGALAAGALRAYDVLMARRAEARRRLGSDDPQVLATVLVEELGDDAYAARATKLDGIRLLPTDRWMVQTSSGFVNRFPAIVNYWRSPEGPFGKMPVDMWNDLLNKVSNKA